MQRASPGFEMDKDARSKMNEISGFNNLWNKDNESSSDSTRQVWKHIILVIEK